MKLLLTDFLAAAFAACFCCAACDNTAAGMWQLASKGLCV
jgi:hypothetical protein